MKTNSPAVIETLIPTSKQIDEDIIQRHDQGVRHRARIELRIVRRTLTALRNAGYAVVADNGEDAPVSGTNDELIQELFACDEAYILTSKPGRKRSFIYLVLGNDGYDVISDYGTSLEDVLKPVFATIDAEQEKGV